MTYFLNFCKAEYSLNSKKINSGGLFGELALAAAAQAACAVRSRS